MSSVPESALEDSPSRWTLVVPIKPRGLAKSRLSGFPDHQRRQFARAFALDAMHAMLTSPLVDHIIVVGDDGGARDGDRVSVVPDPGHGLIAAIHTGLAVADDTSPTAIVVADLPALRATEVTRALATAAGFDFSLICDRVGTGSTMLMGRDRHLLKPHFGERSRAAHVAAGAHDLVDLDVPGLRCDVDTSVDLWDARRLGVGQHTEDVLAHA